MNVISHLAFNKPDDIYSYLGSYCLMSDIFGKGKHILGEM